MDEDKDIGLHERNHLVNIIITGIRFYRVNNIVYCVSYPSLEDIAYSEFLYTETINKYKYSGWLTTEEHQQTLINQGLLDKDFKQKLKNIDETVDEFKVQLFSCINPLEEEQIRKKIKMMRINADKVAKPLNLISGHTVEDVASSVVNHYLLEKSLYDESMNKLYSVSSDLLDKLVYKIHVDMLSYGKLRLLARNDPWRTHWSLSKPNPFTMSVLQWNNDQKVIVVYSKLYDSVYESPDCPSDKIIKDDDKMDGWLIYQRRKREKDRLESEKDTGFNKYADAQEVYIFAPNEEIVKKVESWNSPQAKRIKQNRAKQIKESKTGIVKDIELHDVQQELKMQQNKAFTQSVKNRKG